MIRKIASAIRTCLRMLRRLAAVPGRMIGAMLGGGGGVEYIEDDYDAPEAAETTAGVDNEVVNREYRERMALQTTAACVVAYAADAQVDLSRPAIPPIVPRAVREWLGGLGLADLKVLTDADPADVERHISCGPYIAGLFRVTPLPPVALVRAPAADHKLAWERDGDITPERVEALRVRW